MSLFLQTLNTHTNKRLDYIYLYLILNLIKLLISQRGAAAMAPLLWCHSARMFCYDPHHGSNICQQILIYIHET